MNFRELANPSGDPGISFVLDAVQFIVIAAISLIVLLLIAANIPGLRRSMQNERAGFGSYLSAGIVLGTLGLLALIGFGSGRWDWTAFWLSWLIGVILLWDRVTITGNVLLDAALPGLAIGVLGVFLVAGVNSIYSGQVDFGVLDALPWLVIFGALASRLLGWARN